MSTEAEVSARDLLVEEFPDAKASLSRYVDILCGRGLEWGLLGPREGGRMWSRHIGNSLALVDAMPQGVTVADIGSGAGLPGIPLALARPDLEVTLIEPLLRRANFLTIVVDELNLQKRVKVVRGRAEEATGRYDIVTCRAVAPLERLIRWTHRLFIPGGSLVALKGESAEEEVLGAAEILGSMRLRAEVLELRAAPGVDATRAIRVGPAR